MHHIDAQSGFGIGFLGIGEFICDTSIHKEQRGITMATNFGTEIVINAYKCICTRDNENVITYNNEGFDVNQSKEDIARV